MGDDDDIKTIQTTCSSNKTYEVCVVDNHGRVPSAPLGVYAEHR